MKKLVGIAFLSNFAVPLKASKTVYFLDNEHVKF